MRSLFTKKRSLVALAAVAVLAIAGGAYAYFSSVGIGTGSATVGSASPFIVQSQAATGGPLYPDSVIGGPNIETVNYQVTNTDPGAQNLNQVVVSVANPDGSSWTSQRNPNEPACTAHDFSLEGQPVGTSFTDTRLARDMGAGTQTQFAPVSIEMIDDSANQDNCQGVTVPLFFSAS